MSLHVEDQNGQTFSVCDSHHSEESAMNKGIEYALFRAAMMYRAFTALMPWTNGRPAKAWDDLSDNEKEAWVIAWVQARVTVQMDTGDYIQYP